MTQKSKEGSLRAEIRRLESENAFLRMHLQAGQNEQTSHVNNSNGYLSYLWELAQGTPLYRLIKKLTNYFSKFRLISLTVKIIGIIAIAIETSAFIFIFITVLALLLPPFIIGFIVILTCSASRFHHDSTKIFQSMKDKKVIVYFLSRQYTFTKDCFFRRNVLELSQKGYCVIAVSPFIISPKGISDTQKYYLNTKKEADGIFIIRQQYFFYLKKKYLRHNTEKLIYVY